MSLSAAIAAIASAVRMTPGVVYTPDSPPDQLSDFEFPAVIIFPLRGDHNLATAYGGNGLPVESKHVTLRMDLHVRQYTEDLDDLVVIAVAANELLSKKVWRAFLDNRLNNQVMQMGTENTAPIRWTFGTMSWGGQDTIGFTYELDITTMEDIP